MSDKEIRDRVDELDHRITHWLTHTNSGVVTGVVATFVLFAVAAKLLG